MTEKKDDWEIGASRELGAAKPAEVFSADFERSATLVGQLLERRFLIEKDLTESGADAGGIGLVYLARDMKLMGREVVVKILQKAALKNAEIIRKFQHEKEALIRLVHPNIVRILDSGTLSDNNPFMVMEYISGHSLRKMLREKGRLPFDLAAHVIESVTNALGAAHSKKILHRDIKPENIMLTPQDDGFDHVRLIDFGIARVEESLLAPQTTVGHGAGTLIYIAPEQLGGHLTQTPAVDIYAFSVVIYEMLTGELPFNPESSFTTEAVIQMYELQKQGVQVRPGSMRQDMPPAAEAILLSGLEYDSSLRPQDARRFGRELSKALRDARSDVAEVHAAGVLAATMPANQISQRTLDKPDNLKLIAFDLPVVPPQKSTKAPFYAALALLILAALAIPVGIAYWNSGEAEKVKVKTPAEGTANLNTNTNTAPAEPQRELSYFLNVQKMRNGTPFEAPFKSSGQEIYESGYKFNLVFQPDADGYMYIFNEGKDEQGMTGYYLLFPTRSVNNGSAQVSKGQPIETAQNTFSGGRGTEVMWMIWTKQKDGDLDAITSSVIIPPGAVRDENTGLLQSFLEKNKASKTEASKDSVNQRTVIKAKGDTVVHRFELEHR